MTGLAQGHGWFVAERAWDPRGADGGGFREPRRALAWQCEATSPQQVLPVPSLGPCTEKQGQAAEQLGPPRTWPRPLHQDGFPGNLTPVASGL